MAQSKGKRASKYAAANTTRLTGGWSPADSNVNDILRGSASQVRARVRQLVRDFPFFFNARNRLTDFSVGDGIVFQSRVKKSNGKLNKGVIQSIEDAFSFWQDDADFSGRLHYHEIQRLVKYCDIEAGEFLIIKRFDAPRGSYLPYQLQYFEPDQLATGFGNAGRDVLATSTLDQGIEYNTATNRIVAYHLTDPDSWGKSFRVPAANVIHGFETLRPYQLRGISPFTSGVLIAHDLLDYVDAEIDTAKLAAKYLALITTPDAGARQSGLEVDENDNKIDDMENAIIEYLRPGESVEFAKHDRPGDSFAPFTSFILRVVAIVTNVPYEILSGDYQNLSFTTARTSRNDWRKSLAVITRRHVRQFCFPTMRPFFDYAVLTGKLNLKNYFNNPAVYMAGAYQSPGMEPTDPLRETKAQIDEVKALQRSPSELALARGRDSSDILKEIALFIEDAEENGLGDIAKSLFTQKGSTAVKNNPAAVAEQRNGAANTSTTKIVELVKNKRGDHGKTQL